MSNEYVIVNGELYHHGVKGMRWGVRRSREKLLSSVGKLGKKNKRLSEDADYWDKEADDLTRKSEKVISKNAKYNSRINKATAKKAKWDVKLAKQMSKKNPNADKVAKYTAKSANENLKIMKAQRKLKDNKYAVQSMEAKRYAQDARDKIAKNERLMKTFNNTISAMDAGTIKQGRLFMQYVTE